MSAETRDRARPSMRINPIAPQRMLEATKERARFISMRRRASPPALTTPTALALHVAAGAGGAKDVLGASARHYIRKTRKNSLK